MVMERPKRKRTVKPNGGDYCRSKSLARPSSKFFKIILSSVFPEKKLRIPKKFVTKYGDELSAITTLTVPTGHVSHVGLEKANKMLWFCDGWQRFMEYHSISCGYFLVFNYKGNSSFDVLIFDLTATEIQYSRTIRSSSEENNNRKLCQLSDEEEIEDDDSVEILGSSGFFRSSSKIRLGLNRKGKGAALLESSKTTPRCVTRSKRYKKDQEQTIELENLHGACGRKASRSETSKGHDSLSDKSKRKDQFVTKNVQNLRAPAPPVLDRGFDQSNESKLKDKTFIINEEEQNPTKIANSSHVATQRNKDTSHQTTNQRTVSNGQQSLVKQEWCKIIGINTCSTGGQVINQARERAINAARMFKSENPFHTVILRPYNCLATEFSMKMKYLVGVSDFVKLQLSDGREWHVYCIYERGGRRAKLSKGWRTFVEENNLVEGDVCVFELIKVKDFVLKVSIFRIDESNYSKTTNQRTVSRGLVINQARERAINAARMFKPENPFHMVILRPYNVDHHFFLNLPSEFAMMIEYLFGVSDIVKLQVSDGREWHVHYIHKIGKTGARLCQGWRTFVKENNLMEGDICVFELIKVMDSVLKVSIFRTAEYAGQPNQPHQFDESIYSKTTNQRTVSNGQLVKQELYCEEIIGIGTCSTTCSTGGPVINQARERAINAARMFKSENPFHTVILRPYSVKQNFFLYLATEFCMNMKYLAGVSDFVKLQISDGREWHVYCIYDRGGRRAKLSKGWRTFVEENNLVEGDVCVFELIKALKDLVLQVSIFRVVDYAMQANQPLAVKSI